MEYRILGPLEVRAGTQAVPLTGAKQRALLAALLVHANEPVRAERLALELWGEDAPAGATRTVRVHVSRLRKALAGPESLVTVGAAYLLRVGAGELDADRFSEGLAAGRAALAAGAAEAARSTLGDALALWRGPALDEFASYPFASTEAALLEEQRLAALEARIEADLALGRHAEVIGELRGLVADQPWRERLHGQLMLALYRCGRQTEALGAYRHAHRALADELGVEPGAELRALEAAILRHDPSLAAEPVDGHGGPGGERRSASPAELSAGFATHPDAPADYRHLGAGEPGVHGLPHPATSFVGRERELADARAALKHTRLLTLVGAGGCGKTRLAERLAAGARRAFPDGAWWIDLALLTDEELVADALARTLGIRPLPGMTALQAVCAYLASRRSLVVLDNCEHLLDACTDAVAAVLQSGSGTVVVATSRAPLGLPAETTWRVPSMSLRAADAADPETASTDSDAVRLFVDRAQKARTGFALTERNAAHVAEICAQLDGIPLALELAAARVRHLSVQDIERELADRFALLTGGGRTTPARQRTLRASMDWSHDLLAEDVRGVFRRLSVFNGGFTLDAAGEALLDERSDRAALRDEIAVLVDNSLVVADATGTGMRYHLLETIRQYAADQLRDAGEDGGMRARHRDVFARLVQRAEPHLEGSDQKAWFAILDPEAANLATAIDHAVATDPEVALRLCAGLFQWWRARGRHADAEASYARALQAAGPTGALAGLRARALWARAYLAFNFVGVDVATRYAFEARALADAAGDHATAARATVSLLTPEVFVDPAQARPRLAHAAERGGAVGDGWSVREAANLTVLSHLYQSNHAEAARVNAELARLAHDAGDPVSAALHWLYAGGMALIDGDFRASRDALERAVAVSHSAGEAVETWADAQLGLLDVYEGAPERTLGRLRPRLKRAQDLGTVMPIPMLLTWTAFAEVSSGDVAAGRDKLEAVVRMIDGRDTFFTAWASGLLAEAERLLGDDAAAEAAAAHARTASDRIANRFLETRARLTLGRLAAARGDCAAAVAHALAHLEVCVADGHASGLRACFEGLAEAAAVSGRPADAAALLGLAERASAARLTPEQEHWSSIERGLRAGLGARGFAAAQRRAPGLTASDVLRWARDVRDAPHGHAQLGRGGDATAPADGARRRS